MRTKYDWKISDDNDYIELQFDGGSSLLRISLDDDVKHTIEKNKNFDINVFKLSPYASVVSLICGQLTGSVVICRYDISGGWIVKRLMDSQKLSFNLSIYLAEDVFGNYLKDFHLLCFRISGRYGYTITSINAMTSIFDADISRSVGTNVIKIKKSPNDNYIYFIKHDGSFDVYSNVNGFIRFQSCKLIYSNKKFGLDVIYSAFQDACEFILKDIRFSYNYEIKTIEKLKVKEIIPKNNCIYLKLISIDNEEEFIDVIRINKLARYNKIVIASDICNSDEYITSVKENSIYASFTTSGDYTFFINSDGYDSLQGNIKRLFYRYSDNLVLYAKHHVVYIDDHLGTIGSFLFRRILVLNDKAIVLYDFEGSSRYVIISSNGRILKRSDDVSDIIKIFDVIKEGYFGIDDVFNLLDYCEIFQNEGFQKTYQLLACFGGLMDKKYILNK